MCEIVVAEQGAASPAKTKPLPVAKREANGMLTHELQSELQSGKTVVRVLLPEPYDPQQKYAVVYVLPVEPGIEDHYGDGLLEIQKLELHKRFPAIYVMPSFSALPWYADHPTEKTVQQERYFVEVVVPSIEATYATLGTRAGRLLLGFSKSGWGAWTLLLRHPHVFERAVAWDAPMMNTNHRRFGAGPIFGTPENFLNYQLTRLVAEPKFKLAGPPRLALWGTGNFRDDHRDFHALLDTLNFPHVHVEGPFRAHTWHSGWVAPSLEWLHTQQVPARP